MNILTNHKLMVQQFMDDPTSCAVHIINAIADFKDFQDDVLLLEDLTDIMKAAKEAGIDLDYLAVSIEEGITYEQAVSGNVRK